MTLTEIADDLLRRLGDFGRVIWTDAEAVLHLQSAYQEIAQSGRVFFDMVYLENLPRGFSMTARWEQAMLDVVAPFDYGVANFTAEVDRRAEGDERRRLGPANHTSPFEATDGLLARAHASTAIPATAELPRSLTELDRVTWDRRGIDALQARTLSHLDARYELTMGEVYGFIWQKDGIRTLRKVRVPAAQADTVVVTGSWGLLRNPVDLSGDLATRTFSALRPFSVTAAWEVAIATHAGLVMPLGIANYTSSFEATLLTPTLRIGPAWFTATWEATTGVLAALGLDQLPTATASWGIPRRLPGHHPIGTELFGAPRRPYLDGKNVRVEHYRHGRPLDAGSTICELPDRYTVYLRDYAQAQLLSRSGPGQDLKLAKHFHDRWVRALARIASRLDRVDQERTTVLGGDGRPLTTRPPRPSLPWQYGSRVR